MTDLAFLWHMHQPDYRHPETGEFTLPWVLLHAIKDYTDMAAHLERHPAMHCTVNFVPVLLDQIDDYAEQFASRRWRDPLLRMAARAPSAQWLAAERDWLLDMAFRCHLPTMLEPFPHFRRLRDLQRSCQVLGFGSEAYLGNNYFTDLATWCLLAWTGESLRRESPLIATLMAKGSHFSQDERMTLLDELGAAIGSLIGRYRTLADAGRVELSCTPQAHPLAPLLIDFQSAREAWPSCPMPRPPSYAGGRTRIEAQLQSARSSHAQRFGSVPQGLWPAEGALSDAFLKQIAAAGFAWTASGAGVLHNSAGTDADIYRPWRPPAGSGGDLSVFFRDERLSDLIGFEYAKWHGRDAASHFVAAAEAIGESQPEALVCVILDGENAWETYPYNAWHFFADLYGALTDKPKIRTLTLSEANDRHRHRRTELPRLCAGSWVYGTFSTWIGDAAKNHAWELLCEAKQNADLVLASGRLDTAQTQAVRERLTVCESSDWFWWFGDYNPAASVSSFDSLFRENLKALYRLLHLPVPPALDQAINPLAHDRPDGVENSGTMRRAS